MLAKKSQVYVQMKYIVYPSRKSRQSGGMT